MRFRPDAKTLRLSYTVLALVLVPTIWFGMYGGGPEFFYSARWGYHNTGYGSVECAGCHRPFRKVQNFDCVSQHCHPTYLSGFSPADFGVYSAEVEAMEPDKRSEEEAHLRSLHAHLLYHRLPQIGSMECSECHPEHAPPPSPFGFAFIHDPNSQWWPEDLSPTQCAPCHDANQAPRNQAHAEYFDSASQADCWDCHFSSNSWNEKVRPRAAKTVGGGETRSAL